MSPYLSLPRPTTLFLFSVKHTVAVACFDTIQGEYSEAPVRHCSWSCTDYWENLEIGKYSKDKCVVIQIVEEVSCINKQSFMTRVLWDIGFPIKSARLLKYLKHILRLFYLPDHRYQKNFENGGYIYIGFPVIKLFLIYRQIYIYIYNIYIENGESYMYIYIYIMYMSS